MKHRLTFESEQFPETLSELGYDDIGARARFVFDRPITITENTVIEFDSRRGTFHKIRPNRRPELISGRWDR